MIRTCVLMSTYNGEEFLREQLASIAYQTQSVDLVYIRDDGSWDKTIEIIKINEFDLPLKIEIGANLGSDASFDWLSRNCPLNYDYYFFCDQDDIWSPKKVELMLNCAAENSSDLIISNFRVVWKNKSSTRKLPEPTIKQAITENTFPGACTMISRKLLTNYRSLPNVFKSRFDAFVNLLGITSGNPQICNAPLLYYRVHDKQQIGLGQNKNMLRRWRDSIQVTRNLVMDFMLISNHQDMSISLRKTRNEYLDYLSGNLFMKIVKYKKCFKKEKRLINTLYQICSPLIFKNSCKKWIR